MKSKNKQPQIDPLQAHFERRRATTFWGRKYFVTPRLVEKVFGDGKQLIGFEPLNSRPNFYVVLVDSSWNISNCGEGQLLSEHTDEIYEAIEEQYGCAWYDDDPPQRKFGRTFPALNDGSGVAWFSIKWPAGMEPAGSSQMCTPGGIGSSEPEDLGQSPTM